MSQGPSRAFPTQNYTAIPNVPIQPRQQQQLQMQHSTLNNQHQPYPQLMNGVRNSTPISPTSNNTSNNINNTYSPNNNSIGRATTSTMDSLYCDSCQTFRHISFFHERDFKYKVCNLCQTRDIQKKKHQMEKYEMYEEQQRNYKHPTRYQQQIQYNQQQLHSSSTPINLNSGSNGGNSSPLPPPQSISSSPQIIKQSPPTAHIINSNSQPHLYNSNSSPPSPTTNTTTPIIIAATRNPMRNQPHIQQQSIQSSTISLPLPTPPQQDIHQIPSNQPRQDNLLNRLDKAQATSASNNNTASLSLPSTNIITPIRTAISSASIANPPASAPSISNPPTTHHKSSTTAERATLDVLSLDAFVQKLEKETHFDRKQYHLDITTLIESIDGSPSFTQLGRAICGKILEGTKFNFR
jgi:hypothetical protein